MLYLATHADTDISPDPTHTNEGLKRLVSDVMLGVMSIIKSLGAKKVYVGMALRNFQTYNAYKSVLGELEVERSAIFGNEVSRREIGGREYYVSGYGEKIPVNRYYSLCDCQGFDPWKMLLSLPDGSVIITGREFIKCLGIRSRNCSIYEVDPVQKKVRCIVCKGRKISKLSDVRATR